MKTDFLLLFHIFSPQLLKIYHFDFNFKVDLNFEGEKSKSV